MLTRYLPNPGAPGVCLHNTRRWQVTELMGGLACELLHKERVANALDAAELGLSLHACYPSVFLQGDDAQQFLDELRNAQRKHDAKQVDALLLDGYLTTLN